jgi:GxxExxY protein
MSNQAGVIQGDALTHQIIAAAIEVHRLLGPGLLESAYEECLCYELGERGIWFERQVPLPLAYKSLNLVRAFKVDIMVQNAVLIELKVVDKISKIHEAQVLTYLRLSGLEKALLLNFNSVPLKSGIRRLTRLNPSPVSSPIHL